MNTRLIAALIALTVAGSADAQRTTAMEDTPLFANNQHAGPRFGGDRIPPLPLSCRDDKPRQPPHRAMPDLANDAHWRSTLGISQAQATQVQQLMSQKHAEMEKHQAQREADDRAACSKLRGIIGDQAMRRWADASMPPPPPRPPMPPAPPEPPMPPDAAQ